VGVTALGHQIGEGGNIVIALDQGRACADSVDQALIEPPYRVGHGRVMRVDNQRAVGIAIGRMTGQMNLSNQRCRESVDIGFGAESQIGCADEHVVDVHEQPATAEIRQLDQEVRLRHLMAGYINIERGILDQNPAAQ
jgi:hypothetical protein